MSRLNVRLLALATLLTTACVPTGTYQPPSPIQVDPDSYSTAIHKPFDDVWNSLISYSAKTFFSIDNFERDSGLLTLSFGSSEPSSFIDCGQIDITYFDQQKGQQKFTGSYVDFLVIYYRGQLTGRMNIRVRSLGTESTEVTVHARYVLSAPPNTWAFNTGGSATQRVQNPIQGTGTDRTCRPTHRAEKEIISGISSM